MFADTDEFSIERKGNRGAGRGTRLISLQRSNAAFAEVEAYFNEGWKHQDKPQPKVHALYRILSPMDMLEPYLKYRASVDSCLKVKNFKTPGNEAFLFHGTSRGCMLGECAKNVWPCTSWECSLCSIIRKSFDVKKCGTNHKFQRFGAGIYITACSSKADDYVNNKLEKASLRVLLLNRVVVGKPLRRRFNATYLVEPPLDHHSVVGEPGNDLNYEETVVYDPDAIRPAYLIVYGDAKLEPKLKFRTFIKKLFHTPLVS